MLVLEGVPKYRLICGNAQQSPFTVRMLIWVVRTWTLFTNPYLVGSTHHNNVSKY